MNQASRLDRIERELDWRRPVDDEPDMSPEEMRIAQRIIDRHRERFGPPPAEDHDSIVRWLACRGRAGSDDAIT